MLYLIIIIVIIVLFVRLVKRLPNHKVITYDEKGKSHHKKRKKSPPDNLEKTIIIINTKKEIIFDDEKNNYTELKEKVTNTNYQYLYGKHSVIYLKRIFNNPEFIKNVEDFSLDKSECYRIGKNILKQDYNFDVNGSSIFEIDRNISKIFKSLKIKGKKDWDNDTFLIKTIEKIELFGFYNWFWNKILNDSQLIISRDGWKSYTFHRFEKYNYHTSFTEDEIIDEYFEEEFTWWRDKYPLKLISSQKIYDYYFTYNHYYKDEPYHVITGELNKENKEFDVIRYWIDDYCKKIKKQHYIVRTKRWKKLDIDEVFYSIYKKMFDTNLPLMKDIWNISRSYPFGKIYSILREYMFYKRSLDVTKKIFRNIILWENGELLSESKMGYNNQYPLFIRWNKIIKSFSETGKYLVQTKDGIDWLKNEVGEYIKERQNFYNQYVDERNELFISDKKIRLITEGIDKYQVLWKSEFELYKLVNKVLYDDKIEVIQHYRPTYLDGLEIDIYFEYKRKKIGIEYQGEQHFKPIKFFGGEESFSKLQERDKKKNNICKNNNINLIYYNFDEKISEEILHRKLSTIISI